MPLWLSSSVGDKRIKTHLSSTVLPIFAHLIMVFIMQLACRLNNMHRARQHENIYLPSGHVDLKSTCPSLNPTCPLYLSIAFMFIFYLSIGHVNLESTCPPHKLTCPRRSGAYLFSPCHRVYYVMLLSVCLPIHLSKDTSFPRDNSKSSTAINIKHGI